MVSVEQSAQVPKDRFVVARFPNGGIGDHLSCLMGSWWFARQTGRTLVIDWRGSRFNRDRASGRNCLRDFFEVADTLVGVPTLAGDEVPQLPFSDSTYPSKWTRTNLLTNAHVGHSAEEVATVNRLVASGQDRPEQWVAFNQWIDPPPPRDEARRLLRELPFTPAIREAAGRWFDESVGTRRAVAIHIRHGNGENIGSRAAYWLDPWRFARQTVMNARIDVHRPGQHGRFGDNMPDSLIRTEHLRGSELAFLERVARSVRRMQAQLGNAVPILFCDSPAVVESAGKLMPDLLVPPKAFLAPNAGPLHAMTAGDTASRPTVDQVSFEMCVEMELMRRCSALVCMASGFSIFSKVLLDDERIETLEAGFVNVWLEKVLERLPLAPRH
jgi:hypothetical protein